MGIEQKYFDAKTGLEKKPTPPPSKKKPSFDGESVEQKNAKAAKGNLKAEPKKFDLPREAAKEKPKPALDPGIKEQILQFLKSMVQPDGSSQDQMRHEDDERLRIQERGAPLNPKSGVERAAIGMSLDGQPAYDGATGADQKKAASRPATPAKKPGASASQAQASQPKIQPPGGPSASIAPPGGPPGPPTPAPSPKPSPTPAPPPQPQDGGWVDAGYGTGDLNQQGQQWQGNMQPPPPVPQPPMPAPGPMPPSPVGGKMGGGPLPPIPGFGSSVGAASFDGGRTQQTRQPNLQNAGQANPVTNRSNPPGNQRMPNTGQGRTEQPDPRSRRPF